MSWRNITVGKRKYKWMFGRKNIAIKEDGDRKTHHVSFAEITGELWHDIERAKWKGYFTITPREVAHYIFCVIQGHSPFVPIHGHLRREKLETLIEENKKLKKTVEYYKENW